MGKNNKMMLSSLQLKDIEIGFNKQVINNHLTLHNNYINIYGLELSRTQHWFN